MSVATMSLPRTKVEERAGMVLRVVWRYGLGVLMVAAAYLVRLALDPYLANTQAFSFFYLAVGLAAWRLGWGPGVVAMILGYLTADWFFFPPRHTLALGGMAHVAELLTYFFVAGITVLLIAKLGSANQRVEATAQALLQEKLELEREVEQRKQAEEALARSRDDLELQVQARTAKLRETVSELEHFSYSLTHDLRAPLRAMQSFAGILEEELCSECLRSPGLDYLRRIRVAAGRLDKLITDSLNYSKALREEMPVVPVEVAKLLRGMIGTYPNLQPVTSEIEVELDGVVVLGNEAALTQVFANLLSNAVKFVAPEVKPHVRVRAERKGSRVRIWVEDNGIGIPKVAQQRIFDMFQRLHRDDQYPGTGMGLTIVRKVVQRMGGAVSLESEPGQGSRFWVELPGALG